MAGVLAFDLAPGSSGYCAGDGQGVPTAGAWRFPPLGDDLGALAIHAEDQFTALIELHRPALVVYEAPILRSHDALADLRRIYGLGMELERVCKRQDVPAGEVDLRRVKSILTDNPHASKADVARVVSNTLAIPLPRTIDEGRHDAADAVGVWLIGLMELDGAAASPWLARIRGTLL